MKICSTPKLSALSRAGLHASQATAALDARGALMDGRKSIGIGQVHAHATALMADFLKRLKPLGLRGLTRADLVTPFGDGAAHGNFLCFRAPHAGAIEAALAAADVHADHRGDRMRFGSALPPHLKTWKRRSTEWPKSWQGSVLTSNALGRKVPLHRVAQLPCVA